MSNARFSLLRRCAAALVCPSLLVTLVACGGGGGSPGNTGTYNLDAAITRALQGGVQVTGLTGSLNNVGFTLSMAYTPQSDAVFEGTLRHAVRETVTISGGGTTDTTTATQFFATGPYAGLGAIDSDGSVTVMTPTGSLPTAARVGDSGVLGTGVDYTDASKQTIASTARMTWSLDADTESTALACLRSVINEVGSSTPLTGAQCFRINTAGDVLGAVVSITQGGLSITFR